MRYSKILSGLFHEKVIVCESDYDCLFYQAIMDAIYASKGEIAPAILFTHCGGKQRIETVVKALAAIGVPIAAIADIDILNDEATLQKTTNAFGIEWEIIRANVKKITDYTRTQRHQLVNSEIKNRLTEIANSLPNDKQSLCGNAVEEIKTLLKQSTAWTKIKETGKVFFQGDAYCAFTELNNCFNSVGLFILQVGEIEGFYRPAGGHGSKWWENLVNSQIDFASNEELEDAREFVKGIIDFQLASKRI